MFGPTPGRFTVPESGRRVPTAGERCFREKGGGKMLRLFLRLGAVVGVVAALAVAATASWIL
ncbi:MAG TPA: hypothetical protein VNO34_11085 [Actinomycetota bacterium]|nr:hypothetical protein [Actinomycetota bacterium]